MILGVSGTNSSGKDSVAKYLESKGFFHISMSDLLREEMKKQGIEIVRDNIISFGNQLEKENGAGILAKMIIKKYGDKEKLVISSVRKPPEVDYFHTLSDFKLISVDAPAELRYKRVQLRAREGEQVLSFEEFKKQQAKEMDGTNSQNLSYCKEHADIVIDNDGTLEDLYKKIDKILK